MTSMPSSPGKAYVNNCDVGMRFLCKSHSFGAGVGFAYDRELTAPLQQRFDYLTSHIIL